jgi:thiol-disulfide isomerase/thioredoxin
LAIEAFVADTNRRKEFVERATTLTKTFPIAAPHLGLTVMRQVHRGAPEMEKLIVVLAERAAQYSHSHARQIALHIARQYMIMYTDIMGIDPWLDRYLAWGGDAVEQAQLIRTVKRATGEFQPDNYGTLMPDFTLRDLEGRQVSLSEFRGKFVFIDFWASWCGPCRAAIPHVRAAYEKFKNAPIIFLSISIDRDDEAWKQAAVGPFEAPWLHLTANGTTMARDYGVRAVPRKIVLDPEGKLVADNIMGITLTAQLGRLAEKYGWKL